MTPSLEKRVKSGQNLILDQDVPPSQRLEGWVQLTNAKGEFVAQAYLSSQNKGIGWVISRQEVAIDHAYLLAIFQKAWLKRQSYHQDPSITLYRLFNQDGDGFGGLTIDFYDGFLVFSWYNQFIYQLKPMIIAAFQEAVPGIRGAYEKIRFSGLTHESQHLFGEEAPETFVVLENGVNYQVFLDDGLMTGIFLDQHEVRGTLVDGLAAGKRLLNLFSYTAAFSVAAAMGGAAETTSVDLAKRSRSLSEANFAANNLSMDQHRLVVMDTFDYFKYAKRHGLSYDVIVLDPPSFARSKKRTFSVVKDYHQLVAESLDLLESKGILIASTNAANFSLGQFQKEIKKGLGKRPYRELAIYRLPEDFSYNKKDESSNYLKVIMIRMES